MVQLICDSKYAPELVKSICSDGRINSIIYNATCALGSDRTIDVVSTSSVVGCMKSP